MVQTIMLKDYCLVSGFWPHLPNKETTKIITAEIGEVQKNVEMSNVFNYRESAGTESDLKFIFTWMIQLPRQTRATTMWFLKLTLHDQLDHFAKEDISLCWCCGNYINLILVCYQDLTLISENWYVLPSAMFVNSTSESDGQHWLKLRNDTAFSTRKERGEIKDSITDLLGPEFSESLYFASPTNTPKSFLTFTDRKFHLQMQWNAHTVEPRCLKGTKHGKVQ